MNDDFMKTSSTILLFNAQPLANGDFGVNIKL